LNEFADFELIDLIEFAILLGGRVYLWRRAMVSHGVWDTAWNIVLWGFQGARLMMHLYQCPQEIEFFLLLDIQILVAVQSFIGSELVMRLAHVLIISGFLVSSLTGCGSVLQHNGIGTTDETEIIRSTAYQFGVNPSDVAIIGNVQRETMPTGQELMYNVKVAGKPYRCFMKTILMGHDKPICAKPGDPLNVSGKN
jgi:hypothetical protein